MLGFDTRKRGRMVKKGYTPAQIINKLRETENENMIKLLTQRI
jgi:hypothetical protein